MRGLQTPRFWWDNDHFKSEEMALGAFHFAHQQWLDGICSCGNAEWLGLTEAEFDGYYRHGKLPRPTKRSKKLWRLPETAELGTTRAGKPKPKPKPKP